MQRSLPGLDAVHRRRLDRLERIDGAGEACDVEQARDRAAVAAALVAPGDLAAAVDAFDPVAVAQQPGAVDPRHRSEQPLFLEELARTTDRRRDGAGTAAATSGPSATGCGRCRAGRRSAGSARRRAASRAAGRASSPSRRSARAARCRPAAPSPSRRTRPGRSRGRGRGRRCGHSGRRASGAASAGGSCRRPVAALRPRPTRSPAPRRERRRHAPAGRRGSSSAPARRRRRA